MRPTDGRVITNPENAHSFSHAEIKQAADQMNTDALSGPLEAWAAIATAVTDAGKRFEAAIRSAVSERWEGAAADAAVRGIREFTAAVAELGESLAQQSTPLSAAGSAASRFKAAIPEVPDSSTASTSPEIRNSREEQARDDMVTYYIQPYGMTAPEIPTLPAPVPLTANGSGVPVPTPGNAVPVTPIHDDHAAPSPRPAAPGESSDAGTPAPGDTPSESGAAKPTAPETGGDTSENPADDGAATPPQATTPQQAAVPTTASAFSNTPSSHSSSPISYSSAAQVVPQSAQPSSGGIQPAAASAVGVPVRADIPAATGSSAPAPTQAPRPGTSVPAQPAAQSAAPPPAAAQARPGVPGGTGYSGMVPPGARGRGDGDGEHRSPKYLRSEEHAAELLGEVKPTVPPALGAE
ncbi:hypothetical protein [Nocardia arizonensis]|uniref:hypothetical protein n=1 Tax=Nocardia arizonensis TaxID=1141647 RepID=UPI0006D26038|nr:hypothetical protein [Nocardia arizonensis]